MRIAILIVITLISFSSYSQDGAYDGPTLIYTNQFNAGGQISTSGWGILGYMGKYDGYYDVRLKGVEFLKIKHPKEFKLPNNGSDNSRRFAYGKLNSFQSVRFLTGKKKIVSDKLRHGAVGLGYVVSFGPSFGILKPVYVEVNRQNGIGPNTVERYDPEIHDFSVISGRANFLQGLDKLKLKIGGVFKASAMFEYSGENDGIQQLEVGVAVDVFASKIPIMVEEADNQRIFASIFVSYSLGKKYIRR